MLFQRNAPKFSAQALPPLEHNTLRDYNFSSAAITHVDFFSVVNCHAVRGGPFAGAEEQGASQGGHHVDGARGLPKCVLEKAHFQCRRRAAIRYLKDFIGYPTSFDKEVVVEARDRGGTGVADGRWQGAVKDTVLDEVFGERPGEVVLPQFCYFALLAGDRSTAHATTLSGAIVV